MARRTTTRLIASVAVAGGLLLAGGPGAGAAPPTTTVTHTKGVTETFVEPGPDCEDTGLYEITVTYNGVEKTTTFDDGRTHATFTQTGTFVALSLTGGPDARGHFTVWGGFNQNRSTSNGTFTFNVTGTYEDGTRLSAHAVEHFNVRPDGVANEFSLCHDV